jgi:hypothetical protein
MLGVVVYFKLLFCPKWYKIKMNCYTLMEKQEILAKTIYRG